MPVCFTLSVLDQADNLRRLVLDDDGFIVSSFALHAQLRWSGFLVRFQVTVFHPRFTRLIVSRTSGGSASPLHQRDRNLTCTKPKFSKLSSPPFLSWSPSSILFSSFLGNGSHRLTQEQFAYGTLSQATPGQLPPSITRAAGLARYRPLESTVPSKTGSVGSR